MPAIDYPELVSSSVLALLNHWKGSVPVTEIQVAEIDPDYSAGDDFCSHYGISTAEGANCVVVEATRGDRSTIAACVAPVHHRLNFNTVIRKQLDSRRVSLAPLDRILELTQMEYGSITPVGLPSEWPILIDQRVILPSHVIVGSGLIKSKLRLPTRALKELPSVRIIENLAS